MAHVETRKRFVVGVGERVELAVLARRGGELGAVVDGAREGVAAAELQAVRRRAGLRC